MSEIAESGNDYCIGLKGNQPKLLQQAEQCTAAQAPESVYYGILDQSHGRLVERQVRVFKAPPELSETWTNLASFVEVERFGVRDGESFQHQSWYILSQCLPAQKAVELIQDHRGTIENRVHWVKDVVQHEDASLIQVAKPATLMALLRSWAISIFRQAGHDSITKAIRFFRHDLPKLISFL